MILFISILLLGITAIAQESTELALSKDFQVSFTEGAKLFLSFLNFIYIIVFILTAWLINDSIEATNKSTKWLDRFKKIPKVIRSLIVGILWGIFFYWGFKYNTRLDVVALVFSMLFAMALYKLGINRIFQFISTKWIGLKFLEDSEGTNENQ